MVKERRYRLAEFNSQKEKREIWKEDKKVRLQAQWTDWVKKAAIENPLPVEVVFHILSSRILLTANDSLCEDDQFDRLLFRCATQSNSADMKSYWGPILQGLVVLGANPEKLFRGLLDQDDKTVPQDLAIEIVYALGVSSNFMLTHLQQRARHLESCLIELDKTLKSLTGAASNFGNQLHHTVYDPGLQVRLAPDEKLKNSRMGRAKLLAALMQIVQLVLNDDLQANSLEKGKLLKPEEVDKQLQLNKDNLSLLDRARKKYYEIEKQCDDLMADAGIRAKLFGELGKTEFEKIKDAMGALENVLRKLSETRQREINALSLMQAKIKINQAEAATEKERLGRIEERMQAEKKIEKATTVAKQEAAARKEAEARAEQEAAARQQEVAAKQQEAAARQQETAARKEAERQLNVRYRKSLMKKLRKKLDALISLPSKEIEAHLQALCAEKAADFEQSPEYVEKLLSTLLAEEPQLAALKQKIKPAVAIAPSSGAGGAGLFGAPKIAKGNNAKLVQKNPLSHS